MNDLLRTALLGTGQVPASADSTGTAADALVDSLRLAERERALLLRAGSAAVLRRAGARAISFEGQLDPAAPESRARPSPRLCGFLEQVLSGQHADLVPEVTRGLERCGLRLPEEQLPRALAEREPELRACLLPVLGERGKWLARQRPEWSWASAGPDPGLQALPEDAEGRWLEGTTEERGQVLRLARKLAPERGRAWVASTFKSDKPEQRVAWLKAFEVGLSADDAGFLASALADRSAQVRVTAARTLWRLPEAESTKALHARLEALFPMKTELAVLLPPEQWDKALERLGIEETPPTPKIGSRQWWLAQHVAAISPAWFSERYRRTPQALLEAAREHDYQTALLMGWTSASLRFDARDWMGPLWDAWLETKQPFDWFDADALPSLTAALPPDERFARLAACVRAGEWLELLQLTEGVWPDALARAVLARLRGAEERPELLVLAASRLPLELAPASLAPTEATSARYANLLDEFNAKIDFRRRMAEELRT